MTIESICIIKGNKVKEIKRPRKAPAPRHRRELPTLGLEDTGPYITKCMDLLSSLNLDCLFTEPGESRDPLQYCMPLRVLCSWQIKFLGTAPGHVQLAGIQDNWRKSLALFNLIVKESVSASKALTGHIHGIDRAEARERLRAAIAAEKQALKEQAREAKDHHPKCDDL